jgi:hypothetical protein
MTDDIVQHQIKALKGLIDRNELHVNDIDVFCEKGASAVLSRRVLKDYLI